MQTVTDRTGKVVDVTLAGIGDLQDVVENRRGHGGGTHRERKVARRELRRRGYGWYIVVRFHADYDNQTGKEIEPKSSGPRVSLLHQIEATEDSEVWSRACVSPSAAWDRWNRNRP